MPSAHATERGSASRVFDDFRQRRLVIPPAPTNVARGRKGGFIVSRKSRRIGR